MQIVIIFIFGFCTCSSLTLNLHRTVLLHMLRILNGQYFEIFTSFCQGINVTLFFVPLNSNQHKHIIGDFFAYQDCIDPSFDF